MDGFDETEGEPAGERARITAAAHRFQMLAALRPLESLAVRDGLDEVPMMHMRRGLFSHGAAAFHTDWQLKGPLYAAAWPGSDAEQELRRLYPDLPRVARDLVLPERTVRLELIRLRP